MLKKIKNLKFKLSLIEIKSIRIKVIKFVTFLLALTLITRIYLIHHTYSLDYGAYMKKTEVKSVIKKSQIRGLIYDRFGVALVSNTPVDSIVYRYDEKKTVDDLYHMAFTLSELISVDIDKLSKNNQLAMYVRLNPSVEIETVTAEQLQSLTGQQRQAQVIFDKMAEAYYGGENTIKYEANTEEIAAVVEKLQQLPGIEVITQAKRVYADDQSQVDIVGRVSKGDAHFFDADFNKLMAAGYAINDQRGLSSIEQYYEPLLRGHKGTSMIDGQEVTLLSNGLQGADLTLTIDTELSKKVDEILEVHMGAAKRNRRGAQYLQEGYVVVVNPSTGEILSLNGKMLSDEGAFIDHALGTMHNAFTVGSVVKGATLLTGYEYGVTNFGDYLKDEPMIFADGTKKASWAPLGMINDVEALRYSSNVYFMQQAIRMGGDYYVPKANLNIDLSTLTDHRLAFAQYGLGDYTGIDLFGEQIGLRNQDTSIAKLLDFVIGQSDTYTTLQLAQYISTIATGGNRYGLTLLKDATIQTEENARQILYTTQPYLMNQIDLPTEAFWRVQEGFRQVLQHPEGTGYSVFKHSLYSPAGKTGTAEEFVRNSAGELMRDWRGELIKVNHITFVGYAPYHDPKVAIAVVFPQAELPKEKNPIALEVANEIINAYFSLEQKRLG